MRALILCCLVVLTTCQTNRYDVILNPTKIYEYQYEGMVNFGLGEPRFVESGIKMTCKVKIAGVSDHKFSLQVSDLSYEEFNGVHGREQFIKSAAITNLITAQLVKPFMFDYTSGHVSEIYAAAGVSETVVNIVRGILSFFQVTVKTTEKIYDLEEIGLHGRCQSNYAVDEDTKSSDYKITRVIDVDNCRTKAVVLTGVATAVPNEFTKQRGESVFSTVKYIYDIKPEHGGHIAKAEALEQEFFTPFNVMGGNFRMISKKEIMLVNVVPNAAKSAPEGQENVQNRGNIVFKFGNIGPNIPIMMKKVNDPVQEASDLIERMAQVHMNHIDNANTEQVVRLYQLMRMIPLEGLKTLWNKFKEQPDKRHWFLITAVEANNDAILKFLKERFTANDLGPFEALYSVLLTFTHLEASVELVDIAKDFLSIPISNEYVRNTVVIAYGSLVYKHCAYKTPCSDVAVQPLLDMANKALVAKNNKDMVLALIALGNAGHPGSIKTIMKFLPGVAANPVDLPPAVLSAAVQALRLITTRDPHRVQDISLEMFVNKNLSSEIRMLAFMMLIDTKPPMALVSTVTSHLMEETDLQVGSFAYSYLYSLSKSQTPDNHRLSTACNVAMKILAPKFASLSYYYSKALRVDMFKNNYLFGLAAEGFMLKNEPFILPSEMMVKGKFLFIGRIVQAIEFGIRNEGIKELFAKEIPGYRGDFSVTDLQAILNVLKRWESLPDNKPVFSAYSRFSGQEWFSTDINKDIIRNIINKIYSTGPGSILDAVTKGISWHKAMPLLMSETRYIRASCVGLPVEISKYYQVLSLLSVNAKTEVNPPQSGIMDSEVSLKTEGFIGDTKDVWLFYGVNTKLFQSGAEFKTKYPVALPWKFDAKINIKEKKYSLDFVPPTNEVEVISVRSDVYAVSRNIEDQGKNTPMIPNVGPAVNSSRSGFQIPPEMCADNTIYGLAACVEAELRRDSRPEQDPLNHILGFTNLGLKFKKGQSATPVDRIRFELNCTNPMTMCPLFNAQPKLFQETLTAENCAIFKAMSMNGNVVSNGYEVQMAYKHSEPQSIGQMIMSQLIPSSNWRMAVQTTINPADVKTDVKWGADGKPYEMSMETTAAEGRVNAMFTWTVVPEMLAQLGQIIERYFGHVASYFNLTWQLDTNPQKQVSASLAAISANYYDVEMKFPQYTVYRQNNRFPVPMPSLERLYPSNGTTMHHV